MARLLLRPAPEVVDPLPTAQNRRHQPTCLWHLFAVTAVLAANPCRAYDVLLRWTVPPGLDPAGYRIYTGSTSRTYGLPLDVGLLAAATDNAVVYYLYPNLQPGTPYYVAVTDYTATGVESDYSNEKLYTLVTAAPPPVNAGPDQIGIVGTVFVLGSAPTAGVSYWWQQSAGPAATLSSRTASTTQFTATEAGTFQFLLTAYDSQGVAAQSTVNVTVSGTAAPLVTFTSTLSPSPTPPPVATNTPIGQPGETPAASTGVDAINFRATTSLVTDASTEINEVAGELYPTRRSGLTFGWVTTTSSLRYRDRNSAVDRRLAGLVACNNNEQSVLRVDLPHGSGLYRVHVAAGDASVGGQYPYVEIQDDTNTFATVDHTLTSVDAGQFVDASGVIRTATTWPTDEVAVTHDFRSSVLRIKLGKGTGASSASVLTHVRFEWVAPTATPTSAGAATITPTFTAAQVPTSVPSNTATAISPPTNTPAPPPTSTRTPTATASRTATVAPSPTATTVATRTRTPTRTRTSTATATATATPSPAGTDTPTATPTHRRHKLK